MRSSDARSGSIGSPGLGFVHGGTLTILPGQFFFGADVRIKTLLGSCVAITLWHPTRRIGGMCHYMLPSRQRRGGEALDGRYGDEAVESMVQAIGKAGARTQDFIAHLYGGADTMPESANLKFNVGERNIEVGWELVDRYGFQLDGVDVGDNVPRTVILDIETGMVSMKRGEPANSGRR